MVIHDLVYDSDRIRGNIGESVRSNLVVEGSHLVSRVNRRRMRFGEFTLPSLADLKAALAPSISRPLQVRQLVANVESLHQDPENRNAVFQVASQFNCLEMAAPHLTPEDGVGIYQNDRTQGPACAISAGPGQFTGTTLCPTVAK